MDNEHGDVPGFAHRPPVIEHDHRGGVAHMLLLVRPQDLWAAAVRAIQAAHEGRRELDGIQEQLGHGPARRNRSGGWGCVRGPMGLRGLA